MGVYFVWGVTDNSFGCTHKKKKTNSYTNLKWALGAVSRVDSNPVKGYCSTSRAVASRGRGEGGDTPIICLSPSILKRKRNLPPFKPVNINNNTACSKCVNLFVDNSVQ